jgi:arginase
MAVIAPPIRLLLAPYDSGRRDERMGAGPPALLRAGAADALRGAGHDVDQRVIEAVSPWRAELATAFELQRLVAAAAADARSAGRLPLLLSGNCNTTVGMLGGIAEPGRRTGLMWFDAHGDFNTPDTDPGGFLDGHGLAMTVGRCWTGLTSKVPGFTPLPEERVVLVGARSLDEAEKTALRASAVSWLSPEEAADDDHLARTAEALTGVADQVHVHVDLDVHDPSIAPANGYAAPDGMSAERVRAVIRHIGARLPIRSATLASYDPSYDVGHRMERTALDLLVAIAEQATAT